MKALDNRFYVKFMQLEIGLLASLTGPLKSVKKCLDPFLKFAITFQLCIVQIPFRYCQKQMLNI